MSENETNGASPPVEHTNGSAKVASKADRSDWDRKLSEARAKREKVLSARAMSESSSKAKSRRDIPKPLGMPPRKHAEYAESAFIEDEPERLKFTLSGANALKALFVFCAAAGFGVGTVVGFAVLVGMGVPASDVTRAELGVSEPAASADADIQTSILAVADTEKAAPVDPKVNPPVAEKEVAEAANDVQAPSSSNEAVTDMYVNGLPALPDMLDKDVETFFQPEDFSSSERPVSFPEFSSVRYTRDDLEETEAMVLRTLPTIEAATAEPTNEGEPAQASAASSTVATGPVEPKYFMHAPDGVSDNQLRRFIATLEDKGVALSDIGREEFRVSTTHLRYYSAATAEAAQALASDMGIEARDFSQNERNSARIEVWMAGRPKSDVDEEASAGGVFYWLRNGQREER